MKKWKFAALCLGILLVIFQWKSGAFQMMRDPASISGNTCEGKKFCALVYLAPWCPHCRSALSHTQMLLQKSRFGDTGVRVVVGMGEPDQSAAMANKIAHGVAVDTDDKIARDLGIQGVPAYIVMDKEGTRILEGQEGYAWIIEKFGR